MLCVQVPWQRHQLFTLTSWWMRCAKGWLGDSEQFSRLSMMTSRLLCMRPGQCHYQCRIFRLQQSRPSTLWYIFRTVLGVSTV